MTVADVVDVAYVILAESVEAQATALLGTYAEAPSVGARLAEFDAMLAAEPVVEVADDSEQARMRRVLGV